MESWIKWPTPWVIDPNCDCSFAWPPCSRSLLVVWVWIGCLIYILSLVHTVWCDGDEWWSSEGAKAAVGSMTHPMGHDPSHGSFAPFLFPWLPSSRSMGDVMMWKEWLVLILLSVHVAWCDCYSRAWEEVRSWAGWVIDPRAGSWPMAWVIYLAHALSLSICTRCVLCEA